MVQDTLNEVLNEAMGSGESIEFAGEDNQKHGLFASQENRPTEHVIIVKDEEVRNRVENILNSDDSVTKYEYEEENRIRIYRE